MKNREEKLSLRASPRYTKVHIHQTQVLFLVKVTIQKHRSPKTKKNDTTTQLKDRNEVLVFVMLRQ